MGEQLNLDVKAIENNMILAFNPNAILDISQVCAFYGISQTALVKLASERRIKCRKRGNGLKAKYIFRKKDVDEYVNYIFDDDFEGDDLFSNPNPNNIFNNL